MLVHARRIVLDGNGIIALVDLELPDTQMGIRLAQTLCLAEPEFALILKYGYDCGHGAEQLLPARLSRIFISCIASII